MRRIEGKRILVTGGAGFIGSHLVTELVKSNTVTVLDDLSNGSVDNIPKGAIKFLGVIGNVLDATVVKRLVRNADIVFHLAAHISTVKSVENPLKDAEVNIRGTLNVLEACRSGNKRLVYTSSSAVYGEPEMLPVTETHPLRPASPYAVSKLAAEQYAIMYHRVHNVPVSVVRFFNVYGPRQSENYGYTSVISVFLRGALSRKTVTIYGDGEQTRDFVYVDDAVHALLVSATEDEAIGDVVNIATGVASSVNDVKRAVDKLTGRELAVRHEPARIGEIRHSRADISKTGRLLHYQPEVSLSEGLAKTWEYIKNKGSAIRQTV